MCSILHKTPSGLTKKGHGSKIGLLVLTKIIICINRKYKYNQKVCIIVQTRSLVKVLYLGQIPPPLTLRVSQDPESFQSVENIHPFF